MRIIVIVVVWSVAVLRPLGAVRLRRGRRYLRARPAGVAIRRR
jgi:hypothetical protein